MLIFRQLIHNDSKTLTYILGDTETKECVVIDSVIEDVSKVTNYVKELGLKIKFLAETHVHAEHVAGVASIVKYHSKDSKIVYGRNSGVTDKYVQNLELKKENDVIKFGKYQLNIFETPGHTSGCITYYFPGKKYGMDEKVFTGDLLFVRKCGRTDFQEGSATKMYKSVKKLYSNLDNSTYVYPAHDYSGFSRSTIGEEKKFSIRINEKITVEDFEKMMKEVTSKMALPKYLHFAGGVVEAQKMHSNFFVSGILSELSLRLMKKKHNIETLIHIVPKNVPFFFDGTAVAKEIGVNYMWMPMTPDSISNEKLNQFVGMCSQLKGNFCVSCTHENRTRFLSYYYAKSKNIKDVDYENILFGIKSGVLVKYLKQPDYTSDIGEFLRNHGKGKKAEELCSVDQGQSVTSECGM